ncbi:MAG: LCP family protein [Actinobacteria bacterium]|nr:LCP family protein [Actinomycetota bacterium]
MPPDDRSKYDDYDDNDEDIFKKYSFDDEEYKKDDDYDEDTEISGRHAKRFSDDFENKPEGEEPEKFENDFFTDGDFDFRNSGEADYEDGIRSSKAREKRKKRRIIFTSITVMILLVLLAIGIVFGYRFIRNKYFSPEGAETSAQTEDSIEIPSSIKLGRDLNILIACAGEDLLEPEIKSAILSKYTVSNARMVSLCMPVNTLFDVPGFGQHTLSESIELGGMDIMKLTLKNNLGVDAENYILMDVINIVNKLESIKLELSSDITITGSGGFTTELKEGENIINGETAYDFLNHFSGENPDVSISGTGFQKILADSIMNKIAGEQEGDLAKNLSKINDYIETDLSLEELAEVVSTIAMLDSDNNKIYTLDGRVVPLDEEGNIVIFPDTKKVSDIFGIESQLEDEEPVYETGQTVSVTVLNGVGTKGIAGQVSDILKGLEFSDGKPRYEMGAPGDAENYNFESTLIVVKAEDDSILKAADHISSLLMSGNANISVNEDQDRDIVVIIGKNFDYDVAIANLESAGVSETSQDTAETEDSTPASSVTFVLNILNGEGTQGIAGTVKKILEEELNTEEAKAIEVKETKNADNFSYSDTKIITHTDKSGISDMADRIADILGVGAVSQSSDNPDNVDITIIVGSDFTK